MSRFDKFLAALTLGIILVGSIWGQVPQTNYNQLQWDEGPTTPGSCAPPGFFYNTTASQLWICRNTGHFATFFAPSPFTPGINAGTDVVCGLHGDTITGITCGNPSVDGTTETAFATTVVLPSAVLGNTTVHLNLLLGEFGTATLPNVTIKLKIGSTTIYTSAATVLNATSHSLSLNCVMATTGVVSATTGTVISCAALNFTAALAANVGNTNTSLTIPVDLRNNPILSVTITYSANTAGNAVWLYSLDAES